MHRRTLLALSAIYAILVGLTVWGLFQARFWVVATYDTPQETENWNELREALHQKKKAEDPSEPSPPKRSAEPPIKILFSENFLTVVTWAIVFLSILYWSVGVMAAGAIRTSNQFPASPPDDAPH
ncbi:hypothetical protein DTL21_25115 [Bremerella cremea]|uniref:Uncharacterized protein n=1 Tax=Blastopirellula marina TaxID=124 RepID=A0A2S8FB37_9BACT|nr:MULTISPECIES: hypothetical protein [Pirellulaceae]PQO29352.1 hypothetical protein C5Y83_25070 [Blastopirellula marina]RCS42656.1 hypothetical protein DTL21_25115 [Bremerella cremea]